MKFIYSEMEQEVKIDPYGQQGPNSFMYRKMSNIRRIKSQDINISRHGLQLYLRNIPKLSVEWRMKM